jgi:hypothetical protein
VTEKVAVWLMSVFPNWSSGETLITPGKGVPASAVCPPPAIEIVSSGPGTPVAVMVIGAIPAAVIESVLMPIVFPNVHSPTGVT